MYPTTNPNFNLTPQLNPLTALKQALAAFDETINLSHGLSLADPVNRHRLADAYLQRGEVFQTLGHLEPGAFSKALASYDQALHLASELSIDTQEYRQFLAETHKKRGEVLRMVGTQALETAEELEARRKRYQELSVLLQQWADENDESNAQVSQWLLTEEPTHQPSTKAEVSR